MVIGVARGDRRSRWVGMGGSGGPLSTRVSGGGCRMLKGWSLYYSQLGKALLALTFANKIPFTAKSSCSCLIICRPLVAMHGNQSESRSKITESHDVIGKRRHKLPINHEVRAGRYPAKFIAKQLQNNEGEGVVVGATETGVYAAFTDRLECHHVDTDQIQESSAQNYLSRWSNRPYKGRTGRI